MEGIVPPPGGIGEEDLLDELAKHYYYPPLEEGDITVKCIAERLGISERGAREILGKQIQAGKIRKVWKRGEHGNLVGVFERNHPS